MSSHRLLGCRRWAVAVTVGLMASLAGVITGPAKAAIGSGSFTEHVYPPGGGYG